METDPAPKTFINWQSVLRRFRSFLGHNDARRVTTEVVISYKDHLISEGIAPITIMRVHLIALSRLFGFGVDNRLLLTNPALGVKVLVRLRAGQGRRGYDDAEVSRLLALATAEQKDERRFGVPLLALTGARAGEVFQAWAEHVVEKDGVHCLLVKPAPDGGRLKTVGSERVVPIHSHLIEIGFIDWVRSKGSGPLFYKAGSIGANGMHPSNNATKRVGEWVSAKGFGSANVAPLHGLRHWVKSSLHRVGVQDSTVDYIQGHAGNTVASAYRHVDVRTMAEAIELLPLSRPLRQKDDSVSG